MEKEKIQDLKDRVYTLEEAAQYLKIGQSLMRMTVRCGAIKSFRIGAQYRITREAIEAYIIENTVTI